MTEDKTKAGWYHPASPDPSAEADAAHPDWRDATPEQWDAARDALTDAAHFDAMLIERYPLQRDNYVAYIVAKAASEPSAEAFYGAGGPFEPSATPPLDVERLAQLLHDFDDGTDCPEGDPEPGSRYHRMAAYALANPTPEPGDIVHPSDPRW